MALASVLAGCQGSTSGNWERVSKDLRSTFPTVKQISTDELQNWLNDPNAVKPVLIDRRKRDEYAVSHLAGAFPANDMEEALNIINREGKERSVVVYCSVGYRSSVLARELGKKGYTNIYNLEGSIFKWANEGRPVYRENRQVNNVHPFDSKWRNFLDPRLWYTPGKQE